jgi:hypothetical protein
MGDEDVAQWEDWIAPEHLLPASVPDISVGLAAEDQCDPHAELLQSFLPSRTSETLRRAMDQPPQPEIARVQSD